MIQPLTKPVRVRSISRLQWCRQQPCILYGKKFSSFDAYKFRAIHVCDGPVEASHVRAYGHGGIGTKPSDDQTLPKCQLAHRIFHEIGRQRFEQVYGLDLDQLLIEHNARYHAENPAKPKVERKKHVSILKSYRVDCVCGFVHDVPKKKANQHGDSLKYWCIKKKEYFWAD